MKRNTLIFISILMVVVSALIGYIYTLGWEENAQKKNLEEVVRITERSEAGLDKPKTNLPLDFHRSQEEGGYVLYPLGSSEPASTVPFSSDGLTFPEEYFDSCLSLTPSMRDKVAQKFPFLNTTALHVFGRVDYAADPSAPKVTGCSETLQEGYYLVSNSQAVLFLTHINTEGTITENSLLNISNESPEVFELLFRTPKTLPDGSVVPSGSTDLPAGWVTLTFDFPYGDYPISDNIISTAKASPHPVNLVVVSEDPNANNLPTSLSDFTVQPTLTLLSTSEGSGLIETNPRWWEATIR